MGQFPSSFSLKKQFKRRTSLVSPLPLPKPKHTLDLSSDFRRVDKKTYDGIVNSSRYDLPDDDERIDRIQLRHRLFRYVWQRNFSSPVRDDLLKGINVLDVGCGEGSWVLDTASTYPNSTFHGIDMAEMFPKDTSNYPNVNFSKINVVNDGLPFESNSFDFIHLRFLVQYLTEDDWDNKVLKELIRVLKPGGYLEIMEFDMIFYNSGFSATKLQTSTIEYFKSKKISAVISPHLKKYLPKLPQFSEVLSEERSTPLGNWGGRLGSFAKVYFILAFKHMKLVLPDYMKISGDEYDNIINRFDVECELNETYIKTCRIYCKKCV
ncbi:S-adenosyl-L-methionine-dependent methyltransferase [Gigaspora rosea]|uniref:S-adenosyl-L-methionine-dependent methyltransferase n=1 Tax=Gigaspora rosea TaxID=44941 RepID=A0A397W3P4_9GLOM|nr:S-adenosyl-L-methionine-dependent methyltransferase [Gigaspora rosea]